MAVPKVRLLLRVGARVTVAAPNLCLNLDQQAGDGCITHIQSHFASHLLTPDTALVVAAAEQPSENRRVAQAARERNIPINVVDQPDLCTFIFPAIVDRSPVSVAVSTAGNSPALARLVREHLEAILPNRLGQLALFAGGVRRVVKTMLPNAHSRRRFWEIVLRGPIAHSILQGNNHSALRQFNATLDGFKALPTAGDIAWITVASGDLELLTLKALRVLQQSDVIFYDDRVEKTALNMARRDAAVIHIGNHQRSLNQLATASQMIRFARRGKRVCRLSRQCPYALGGNREEIIALLESGVHFQMVPGVSDDWETAPHTCTPPHPSVTQTTPNQHRSIASVFRPGDRHVPVRYL